MDFNQVVQQELKKIKDEGLREGLKLAEQELKKIKDEGLREGLKLAEQELKKIKDEGLREGKADGLREGKADGLREGKADGLRDGLREGKAEGLRGAIGDLCELLAIELTPERTAHLAALDLAGLDALRLHLKAHKAWPSLAVARARVAPERGHRRREAADLWAREPVAERSGGPSGAERRPRGGLVVRLAAPAAASPRPLVKPARPFCPMLPRCFRFPIPASRPPMLTPAQPTTTREQWGGAEPQRRDKNERA